MGGFEIVSANNQAIRSTRVFNYLCSVFFAVCRDSLESYVDFVEANWYFQHRESKVLRKFAEFGGNHRLGGLGACLPLRDFHSLIFVTRWQ